MLRTTSSVTQALTKFVEAVWFDLPAEAGKILLGVGNEKELHKAGWKAYDAWINLANEFTNAIYSDPIVGEVAGQAMESALRLRHISGAVAAATFGNLWPAIGLPTHSEMAALREELLALRAELAAYAAKLPVSDAMAKSDERPAPQAIWKDAQLNSYGAANSNSGVTNGYGGAVRRLAVQEKRHAAV